MYMIISQICSISDISGLRSVSNLDLDEASGELDRCFSRQEVNKTRLVIFTKGISAKVMSSVSTVNVLR